MNVILILLWVAAAGALILLPAIFVALDKAGINPATSNNFLEKRTMNRKNTFVNQDSILEAVMVEDSGEAW